ncbi:hypothetical protein ACFL0V_02510 [Nanoarchaeota archaeon]
MKDTSVTLKFDGKISLYSVIKKINIDVKWIFTDLMALGKFEDINKIMSLQTKKTDELNFFDTEKILDLTKDLDFIWGVFLAFPKDSNPVFSELPHSENRTEIQHELEIVEVRAFDGDFISIISQDEKILGKFKQNE